MIPAGRLQRAAAVGCFALGLAVLAGWALGLAPLKHLSPGLASMKANTALGFVLAGAALGLAGCPSARARRLARATALGVFALGAASALQTLFGADFGFDQLLFSDPDTPPERHPGRMSLATAFGFAAGGVALIASLTAAGARGGIRLARSLAAAVAALAALGLIGYSTDVDIFYALPGFGSLALHTALGFAVFAAGLFAAGHAGLWPAAPPAEGEKLQALATRMAALAAAVTGIAAFAMLGRDVRHTLAQGLEFTFASRTAQIAVNFRLREELAGVVASRPNLLRQVRQLAVRPDDTAARAEARRVLESFHVHGLERIELRDARGRLLVRAGAALPPPTLTLPLAGANEAWLLWRDDGFHLRHRLRLADHDGALGYAVSEQRLPSLTQQMLKTAPPWRSADFRLCRVEAAQLACFPSYTTPRVTREPLGEDDATALSPGFHALTRRDGRRTLAVVGPVGDSGLTATLEVDTREIYRPIAQKFLWTLALIAMLGGVGALALKRRLHPLVARLVDAEAASRANFDALRKSTALARSVFDDNPDAVLIVDADGQLIDVNPRAEALFARPRASLVGASIESLLPQRYRAAHLGHRERYARQPNTRSMGSGLALYGLRGDGGEFPVDVVLSPIRDGGAARTLAIVRDVSERKLAEQRIADALAEKTILLQEIHHRVKNNLQVIVSLLNLQAGNSSDEATRAALVDSQGRVKSMALLHQLLYEKHDFARVDLGDYLQQLVRHAIAGANAEHIDVSLDLVPLQLDLQRAVPCGLLVNELLSNACKHAFPHGRPGKLNVSLAAPDAAGYVLLAVSDDGVGMPTDVEPGTTRSLGLQLVPLLAEQLGATLALVREGGTRFEIRFRP